MATCPKCGTSSRVDPTAITLSPVMVVKPPGGWSLAGVQSKCPGELRCQLSCRCGWSILGRVDHEGNNFIADPPDITKEH